MVVLAQIELSTFAINPAQIFLRALGTSGRVGTLVDTTVTSDRRLLRVGISIWRGDEELAGRLPVGREG